MQKKADADLVALAHSGNKDAFGQLIERYQPMVIRIATRMVIHEEIARELVQEAVLAAYLSLDQLRGASRFKSWLYSITLNVCRSYLREQKMDLLSLENVMGGMYRDAVVFPETTIDPHEVAEERELHRLVLKAVHALSPKERAATLLFYYEQLTLQEIAAILGVSVTAVKSRLFKARKQLRVQLSSLYADDRLAILGPQRRTTMAKVIIEGVRKNFLTDQRVVTLLDETNHRFLNIWIGQVEALVIAMALTEIPPPRPMTAHFLANVLKVTGVTLEEVRVEALKGEFFYAIAKVRNGDVVRELDVRPSDALGLAALMSSPIYVAEELLETVGTVLPEGKTVDIFIAEEVLKGEGIVLPEGKTLRPNYSKEKTREAILQEVEKYVNATLQVTPPTEEKREQAKQKYLAFLLGDQV
jgi:RNA polymerase sigma factor (sigma-70 family)